MTHKVLYETAPTALNVLVTAIVESGALGRI